MRIETTRDFQRPRARVLAAFRDPGRFSEVMQKFGIASRLAHTQPVPRWDCAVTWRNEPRQFTARLEEVTENEAMHLDVASTLASAGIALDFYDLPDGGCRVIARADVTAHTMMAKLALQSLRLVRGKAEGQLNRMIHAFGRPKV
ncbi:MAG: hypothetical protein H6900_02310 [Rhodobacter sp.]|uniref:hypothetical protein n=1 Tax=Pararhodobacter sp. TaxID=2127056 RepID=UPI001D5A111F|nr:hypothetical protein [Pararhodobacter sp.]MCB1343933.1 hypothetical protein [Paracoccaceae bacterium]MCC0072101.1 hypothetical protein [Rhodobacter sp.]HPD93516.1 hypothetical protein [Pararhodobacter sp.]